MLRALFEADVRPDLILGTSVGALNGALVAADPTDAVIGRLLGLWESAATTREVYGDGPVRQVTRAVRTGTHLHSAKPLRDRLVQELGDLTFAELAVPFQCCAARIEDASEHWFTQGRVTDAVMASAAVPGLLRPAEVERPALPRRRHRELDPGGPGRRVRRDHGLRAPGRPGRPAAQAADQAVGGRPGLLRDRPPAPVPPGDGRAARARHRARAADRRGDRPPARTRCWATATSRPISRRIDTAYDATAAYLRDRA